MKQGLKGIERTEGAGSESWNRRKPRSLNESFATSFLQVVTDDSCTQSRQNAIMEQLEAL